MGAALVMLIKGQDFFPCPATLKTAWNDGYSPNKSVFELLSPNHFTNKSGWENFQMGEIAKSHPARKKEGEKQNGRT